MEVQNDNVFLKEEVRYLAKLKNSIIVRSVETQTETIEIKLPIKVNKNKWFKRKFARFNSLLCN